MLRISSGRGRYTKQYHQFYEPIHRMECSDRAVVEITEKKGVNNAIVAPGLLLFRFFSSKGCRCCPATIPIYLDKCFRIRMFANFSEAKLKTEMLVDVPWKCKEGNMGNNLCDRNGVSSEKNEDEKGEGEW